MPAAAPLWIDADPSAFYWTGLDCDDDLALLAAAALHRRGAIDLRGLGICGGNAPLAHTWNDARLLWEHVDGRRLTGVAPVKGGGWRSMQVAVGLLRILNLFFPDDEDSDDAPGALAGQLFKEDATAPIDILTLGPPTNLARALRKVQQSASSPYRNINHVYLMGGEMTNRTLDLNFRSDRGGARAIVAADVPTTIVPIQTCGQVAIAREHLERFRCDDSSRSGGDVPAVCALLPKMMQQIRFMPRFVNRAVRKRMNSGSSSGSDNPIWTPSPNLDRGFIPWDLVALLSISHPEEFARWEYHRVSFPPCRREPCDGNMIVEENLGESYFGGDGGAKNWSGIVRVPHLVKNETRLIEIMLELIGEVPAASAETPRMMWGFVGSLAGFVIATIAFLVAVHRSSVMRSTMIPKLEGHCSVYRAQAD